MTRTVPPPVRWDPAVLGAPLLDHRELDLDGAGRVSYLLEQSFRYDYDAPVEALRQRLVVVPPPRHGGQRTRGYTLTVTGARARRRVRRDARGNVVAWLRADRVPRYVEFRLAALIERAAVDGPPRLPAAALRSPWLLRPTSLTAADARLRALARDLTRRAGSAQEAAERICVAVGAAIGYEYGVTSVATTAAEALATGRGVCQDSAHVMLALCHLARLPARYVSGHLLGQGGTHAWVEVILPRGREAVAIGYDPCNARQAGAGYVTVATGRDYRDVAPTSGTFCGPAGGRLTTGRRLGVLAAA